MKEQNRHRATHRATHRANGFHDECGVFGVFGHQDAAALTALGLHALQHRGQEAAGIVSWDGVQFRVHRALGLVGEIFSDTGVIGQLPGHAALGHTRYATTGETALRNVQPLFADLVHGGFAIAHNGNLTNAKTLRRELVAKGALFQSTLDTEVLIHLMAQAKDIAGSDMMGRLASALRQSHGAFAIGGLSGDHLFGVRDPYGVRPLLMGKLGSDAWILASESCAFDIIGATVTREVEPGEMVVFGTDGVRSFFPLFEAPRHFCVFEYVYFSRPDSFYGKRGVYEMRQRMGAELAREAPAPGDATDSVITPVPDSGVPAAIGYAEESGRSVAFGIIRNHYVGRTFIEPLDHIRHLGVKLKHNANRSVIAGKRVILIDDSLVRGTTATKIVEMVRAAGATEIHLRIASPPTIHSCFYGVDTPEETDLMAHQMTLTQMRDHLRVDSLNFLSREGMYRALVIGEDSGKPMGTGYCDACFSGRYMLPLTDRVDQEIREQTQLSLLSDIE